MSRKTVKKVQLVFRVIALLGWVMFVMALMFYMGGCPRSEAALWTGLGCGFMLLGLAFGGVLGRYFR